MLTDTLFDASEDIDRYLCEYPEVYQDTRPAVQKLLKLMGCVGLVLGGAPGHEEIKDAIEDIDLTELDRAVTAGITSIAGPKMSLVCDDDRPMILKFQRPSEVV